MTMRDKFVSLLFDPVARGAIEEEVIIMKKHQYQFTKILLLSPLSLLRCQASAC